MLPNLTITILLFADRKSEPLLIPDAKDHSKVDSSNASQKNKAASPQTVKTLKAKKARWQKISSNLN